MNKSEIKKYSISSNYPTIAFKDSARHRKWMDRWISKPHTAFEESLEAYDVSMLRLGKQMCKRYVTNIYQLNRVSFFLFYSI
jgi:hypothetical protein